MPKQGKTVEPEIMRAQIKKMNLTQEAAADLIGITGRQMRTHLSPRKPDAPLANLMALKYLESIGGYAFDIDVEFEAFFEFPADNNKTSVTSVSAKLFAERCARIAWSSGYQSGFKIGSDE